jgi:hypothetical protein
MESQQTESTANRTGDRIQDTVFFLVFGLYDIMRTIRHKRIVRNTSCGF